MMRIVQRQQYDENDEDENKHDRNAGGLANYSIAAVIPSIFLLILQHLRVIPELKVIDITYRRMLECRITVGRLEYGLQFNKCGKLLYFTEHRCGGIICWCLCRVPKSDWLNGNCFAIFSRSTEAGAGLKWVKNNFNSRIFLVVPLSVMILQNKRQRK